jgi:hypothetical protein
MESSTLLSLLIFFAVLLFSARLSEILVRWLLSGRGRAAGRRPPSETGGPRPESPGEK